MFAKTFRNTLVASTLLIGSSLLAGPALAQNFDDTFDVGGTVNETLNLTTTPVTDIGTTLDLDTNAEQIVKIADLVMNTNNETGYTLTVSQGNLAKTGGTSIAYRVAVTTDATPAVTGDFTSSAATYEYETTGANAVGAGARDLSIRYTPGALQDPGLYEATITLSILDN